MKNKLLVTFVLIIVLLSFNLFSCNKQADVVTTTKVAEAITSNYPDIIELTLDGERKGSDIFFYGSTNLPDGVFIVYEVTIPEQFSQGIENPYYEAGNLIIKDSKFSGKVSNVPNLKAEIWIAFQTILGTDIKQPQGVIDKYGELGEKMKGENMVKSGDIKRIELIINK